MSGRGRRDEDGVSNVLGAILMFGLLVLTLAMIQVRFVPVWEEGREARHMQQLSDQMRQIKSDVDRQAGNDTATIVTDSLTLKREGGFRFFASPAGLGASTSFSPSPDGTGVTVSSLEPVQVLSRGGRELFGLSDLWPAYIDDEIEGVGAVNHLRVRIDNAPDYDDGDSVTLTVYGAADDLNPIGWATITFIDDPSEQTLGVQVFNEAGSPVSSDFESFFQQTSVPYFYFDLLDPALLFEQVLAQGQAPYRFELIEDGLVAAYQFAYIDANTGGFGGAGASGTTEPSFTSTTESGSLSVEAQNQHFVDQTYVLEHGAVILAQGDGSAIVAPPALGVALSAEAAALTWTMAGLTGDSETRSGSRVAVVATPQQSAEDVWLLASELTFDIPTDHGDAWADYFQDLFQDAGFAAGQYTIASTSARVLVDIEGPVSGDPTNFDVSLRLRISAIDVSVTPAG